MSLVSLSTYAGWSKTKGPVGGITSHNGTVLIDTEITDGPCGHKGGFYWKITDSDHQTMLSLALTSQTTGKKISVVFNTDTPSCLYSRAEITHMSLRNDE